MGTTAEQVLIGRAERDAAKVRLDAQVARLKADYDERGIGGRIAEEIGTKAASALDGAADIAGESKGVIAGTIGLLALWLCRKPILSALDSALGSNPDDEGYETDDHE